MTDALPRLPDATINTNPPAAVEPPTIAADERQAMVAADGALIPVIYGRQRVGANIFAVAIAGNELWLGCLWAIGPCEAIEFIEVNDIPYAFGAFYRTDYLGSITQGVDPKLATLISGYADTLVTSIGGTQVPLCYSVLGFTSSADGFPQVAAVIKGRKVYDPRDGTTVYSRNPALCLADWISNPVYGQGLTPDWTSVGDVADECDDSWSDDGARRELDLVIDSDLPVAQWTDILRTYAACFVVHDGSAVKLVADRPATATRSIDASDIIEESFVLRRLPTSERPTVCEVDYTDNSVSPWRTAYVQAKQTGVDSGLLPRRVDRVSLPGITRRTQAYREALERLNAATITDLEASWVTFDEGLQDLVGDVVNVTHPVGLTAVPMRLIDVQLIEPGRWQVSARSYDADVYSDSITPPSGGDFTELPDPSDIPDVSSVVVSSGSAYLLRGTDGSIVSRMGVSWSTGTYQYTDRTEVQFKRATDSVWASAGSVAETSAICAPVEDGVTYDVRLRIINTLGQVGAWLDTQHVVVGKTEPPPDVESFSVAALADGTRSLSWTLTAPVDLAGYEVRYVAGSSGTWASMTPLHTGLLIASPHETNSLAAGTYTFAIKAVDTSGNYSTNDSQIVVTLPDPRLSGVLDYIDVRTLGWPGTKTNCWVDADGILYATDTKTWAALGTDGKTWATWTTWARDANDLVYTHSTIDVGVVTTFTPLVTIVCPAGTALIEERTSDDNVTWSSWTTAASAPVTCRYYEARVTVSGAAGLILRLEGMAIVLDADPLEEEIEDLDTSTLTGSYRIGTGDIRLPLAKDFAVCRTIFVTLQSVGAGWSWELIDKTPTYGPRIKIYNASNAAADATIDAIIRGL